MMSSLLIKVKLAKVTCPETFYLFNQISEKTAQSEVSLKQSTRLLKNKPPIITLYKNL